MNYYIIKNNQASSIQLSNINHTLQEYGYFISKEDFVYLQRIQQTAYQRNHLVDISSDIIFTIAQTILHSPYIHVDQFLSLIESFINLFYDCKSRTSITLYDDEFVETLYNCYLKRHGVVDIELIQAVLKEMQQL